MLMMKQLAIIRLDKLSKNQRIKTISSEAEHLNALHLGSSLVKIVLYSVLTRSEAGNLFENSAKMRQVFKPGF